MAKFLQLPTSSGLVTINLSAIALIEARKSKGTRLTLRISNPVSSGPKVILSTADYDKIIEQVKSLIS